MEPDGPDEEGASTAAPGEGVGQEIPPGESAVSLVDEPAVPDPPRTKWYRVIRAFGHYDAGNRIGYAGPADEVLARTLVDIGLLEPIEEE